MRSSRVDTFTLLTLGRLTLLSPSGQESESLAKRRLKLALLAVLATAKRPLSRATLAEMFWGDQDEARARHSLSNALSHLRAELGRGAITTHGTEVALAPDAPVVVDALMFAGAADARNLSRAAELYAGPFLDGVGIEAGPSFEQWVSRERRRLEAAFLQVCAQQCLALARAREWDQCGVLAARWLDAAPLSVDAALFRLNAVKAPGTREAAQRALDEFDQLTARLSRDFEMSPEKPVKQLVEGIRENLHSYPQEAISVAVPAAEATVLAPNVQAPVDAVSEQRIVASVPTLPLGRRLIRLAAGGVAVLALLAAVSERSPAPEGGGVSRPRVAISVDVSVADTGLAWLVDGLPQMIVAQLARSPDLEVVPPVQVRALLQRRGAPSRASESADDLRELARRLGATLIVSGTIGRDDRALVLDLTVRDAATGRLLRNDALSRPDAIALADEAAARVLAAVNAERPGLRFADLETSSVQAYQHFIRAMEAEQRGHWQESLRDLDAAIALDSGFVSAVNARLDRAISGDEPAVTERLREVLRRNGGRASEFDRLRSDVYDALFSGEFERSEAIARQLVRRYPRDPRSYGVLNDVLGNHLRLAAAEKMWQHTLTLDSRTMTAGSGPCSPCAGYGALARNQMQQGKWAEAERSVRRWVALQPDAPAAWETLALFLAYKQRDLEAVDAIHRAVSLSGGEPGSLDLLARVLMMVRRYDAVDSLIAPWIMSPSAELRVSAQDVRTLLLRERGQFRASALETQRMTPATPNAAVTTVLMRGNNLGRLGDYAGAIQVYEESVHGRRLEPPVFPPPNPGTRGFCWHHALLADALESSNDVARLRAIADTLEVGCAKSFYGRDRVLYHYVRGLVAMKEGRWLEADSELRQALYGVAEAWTRARVALAKTKLVLGQPRAAVSTLRDAYATPLDGMGRYQPRSELDFLMAQAFGAAGERDSAAVYFAFARRAWRNADPEVKRLLEHYPEPVVASR